jgi:hypothetical protein
VISIAGWINQHQQDVIEYLIEENRVLREQIGNRRLRSETISGVGESRATMTDLLAENTIFFNQVSDGMLLMLVHPTSQGDQQKPKGIQTHSHCRIIALSTMHPPDQ